MLLLPPFKTSSNPHWNSLPRRALAANSIPIDTDDFKGGPCNCPDDPCWGFFGKTPYRDFQDLVVTISGVENWNVARCIPQSNPSFSVGAFDVIDPNGVWNVPHLSPGSWSLQIGTWTKKYFGLPNCSGSSYLVEIKGVFLTVNCADGVSVRIAAADAFVNAFRLFVSEAGHWKTAPNSLVCGSIGSEFENGCDGTATVEVSVPILSGVCLPSDS